MKTQQIVFLVWKSKKNRYTKIPESHIGGIEDISQKMLKKTLEIVRYDIRGLKQKGD